MMPPSRKGSQWEEGMSESTSPPIASSGHDEVLRCQMYQRLVAGGHPGASKDPSSFQEKLYTHFQRLPRRYLVDYMSSEAEPEDVLLHMEILDRCEDPENRPVFVARFIKYLPAKVVDEETNTECDPCQRLLQDLTLERKKDAEGTGSVSASSRDSKLVLIHEIIFSSLDRPKILSRLTSLLSEVDLNIREAHVYNTTDGYCLDVFVVEGWKTEGTDELITKIKDKLLQKNASPCNSTNSSSSDIILELRQQIRDSEINWSMLTKGEKIASGSSADLHRGTYNGLDVAIKMLRIAHHNSLSEVEFLQEVLILRRVEDENILKFYGACTSQQNYCIVTEYMPEGNLYDFLHKQNDPLDLLTILRIAISISKGMKYLHLNNIIHRDLKTANVLLGSGQVVKIADFGVARLQEGQMTAETGTYRWMAPEIINHEPYNHKADVFSFAIVLWELITLKVPYDNMTPMQAALGVRQGNRLEIPQNAHPRLSKLIQQCWDQDPDVRPAFVEILKQLEDIRQQVQAPKGTRRRSRTEMQKKVPVRFREVSGVGEEDSEKGEHLKEGSSSIGLNGKTESAR